jgi:hypothetical protein
LAKWSQVSWKRVGLALLITLVVLPLLVDLGYRQLAPWLLVRSLVKTDGAIESVPSPLPDNNLTTLPGDRVERFGFSFQLPWKQIDRERTFEELAFLSAENGTIIVREPSSRSDRAASLRLMANAIPAIRRDAPPSNYDLMREVMQVKPGQVKWWKTPGQNMKALSLLSMKSTLQIENYGALYDVNFGNVRGIQQGSPSIAPYQVILDLFDDAVRHYEIEIVRYQGRPDVTQAQINAIVASIRPASQASQIAQQQSNK